MENRIHHFKMFKNYCPYCHKKGTLSFEEGSASYTSPEGMWYCTRCDADFCLVHGKEHINNNAKWLSTYSPKQVKTEEKTDNKTDLLSLYKEFDLFKI